MNSINPDGTSKLRLTQMRESWIFLLTPHWLSIKPEKRETFETQNNSQFLGVLRKTPARHSSACRQKFQPS
ncbi:hypothetical protein CRENPOLYSF2_4010005 [Crenothrix polyspora]|uniref:Uncharacterized protein n=1 Tax=Crenothrix polyspora TaxID=360316 RepID=A0A1R4HEP9_9GAMM|nr:hypothetical protein CRENPOLYSF2_4010005 [Crenothrix polyspora]